MKLGQVRTQSVGEMLCLKLLQQFFLESHLNDFYSLPYFL